MNNTEELKGWISAYGLAQFSWSGDKDDAIFKRVLMLEDKIFTLIDNMAKPSDQKMLGGEEE